MDLRDTNRPTVNFLSGPDSDPSRDGPKLSDAGGVPTDMGSAAFERVMPAGYGSGYVGSGQQGDAVRVQGATPAADLSDAEIMLRVKAGDDAAFNYLVENYRRAMISFMYRMVHNAAIAEELAQEVFLRVYRSREGYAANAKFTTWLYRIATNLAVNHARDNKHERPENKASLDEIDEETGLSIDVADGTLNIEQQIFRRERLRPSAVMSRPCRSASAWRS